MSHRIDRLALALLVSVGISLLPHAAGAMPGGSGGGGGGAGVSVQKKQQTPEQQAAKSYEQGERARDRALAYEAKARESDAKGFLGLGARPSEKAAKEWRKSAAAFRKAAGTSPELYSTAYVDLCVAHRKLGELEESLAAADWALKTLKTLSGYTAATACRGETLLELGHLAEAKQAWESLNARNHPLAAELMQRMEAWLDRNERQPEALPNEALEEFQAWMRERGGLASR